MKSNTTSLRTCISYWPGALPWRILPLPCATVIAIEAPGLLNTTVHRYWFVRRDSLIIFKILRASWSPHGMEFLFAFVTLLKWRWAKNYAPERRPAADRKLYWVR